MSKCKNKLINKKYPEDNPFTPSIKFKPFNKVIRQNNMNILFKYELRKILSNVSDPRVGIFKSFIIINSIKIIN